MSRQIRLASNRAAAEQLTDDVKGVIDDAEALVQATAEMGGEKLTAIRDRAAQSLKAAQARMAEARDAVVTQTRARADAADL
jgi:ElaB/YqjD/DUF883 family membrane-anchored ribosome-binding protein